MTRTYSEAGVDIARGERFAEFVAAMDSPSILRTMGSFAGGVELDTAGMAAPLLLSATDGVGTKILVARSLGVFDTIGIDLVAMSVNDLLVCGARPLQFLDYIACGRIDEGVLQPLIGGVVRGCELAGCTLAGGETVEMPDVYGPEDFDLAGFAVGLVDKAQLLPRHDDIRPGDLLFGLSSSGIHSNGLSLARRLVPEQDTQMMQELLKPTRIYTPQMSVLLQSPDLLGAAHITGGGLEGNLRRAIPRHMHIELSHAWAVPEVFSELQRRGGISEEEMRKTFNMGIGIALVVRGSGVDAFLTTAQEHGIELIEIGRVAAES